MESIAWEAQAETHIEALELQARQGRTVTQRMQEEQLGIPSPGEDDMDGSEDSPEPDDGSEWTASDSGVADD